MALVRFAVCTHCGARMNPRWACCMACGTTSDDLAPSVDIAPTSDVSTSVSTMADCLSRSPQPLSPDYPCTVCGSTGRWQDRNVWRCRHCWPPDRPKRKTLAPSTIGPCHCGATGLEQGVPYEDGSTLLWCQGCHVPRYAVALQTTARAA